MTANPGRGGGTSGDRGRGRGQGRTDRDNAVQLLPGKDFEEDSSHAVETTGVDDDDRSSWDDRSPWHNKMISTQRYIRVIGGNHTRREVAAQQQELPQTKKKRKKKIIRSVGGK